MLSLGCWLAVATTAGGCQWRAEPIVAQKAPIEDACAERLHDICGQLLLYWSAKGQLPERLEGLREGGTKNVPSLVCPVSDKPYSYSPVGLEVPGSPRRVLVYDAVPCHSGMRWAIAADPSGPGKPLITRVVLMRDDPKVFAPAKK